jgi:hypothetical protein
MAMSGQSVLCYIKREWNENDAARREKRAVETEERKINFGFLISN